MNLKFILFCIAGIGTIMLLYMWFTMNKTITNSQLIEEQYLYRISSLKSEIDFEKRLMENLRKDIKINSQNYQQKKVLLESMKKREIDNENQRSKLEKEIESLKMEHEKAINSLETERKRVKAENDAKILSDEEEIEKLKNKVKILEMERDELLTKQKMTSSKTVKIIQKEINNKPNPDIFQGKPPSINKHTNEKEKTSNEEIENDLISENEKHIQNDHFNINKQKEGLKTENKNIKIVNKETSAPDDEKIQPVDDSKRNAVKKEIVSQSILFKKSKNEKNNESQLDSPNLDLKIQEENKKEQFNQRNLEKPQNQQLNPPKRLNKEDNKAIFDRKSLIPRQKDDDEGINQESHQLKPPKKEDVQKNKVVQQHVLDSNNQNNKVKIDQEMESDREI